MLQNLFIELLCDEKKPNNLIEQICISLKLYGPADSIRESSRGIAEEPPKMTNLLIKLWRVVQIRPSGTRGDNVTA